MGNKGDSVAKRLALIFAPFALASSLLLLMPSTAAASGGMTETGITTYELVPDKAQVKVTIKISIANHKPDSGNTYYYWNYTYIAVEKQAGAVSVTSNAGRVSQKVHDQDNYYRYLELDYPQVRYGQTRVVTATYTIPAGPKAGGGFRALSAYGSLCGVGNGEDSGSILVVIPDGFDVYVDSGSDLTKSSDANGKQVWTTGTQASPYKVWTCLDAENEAKLTSTDLTASSHPFTIQSWPEDKTWATEIKTDVTSDVAALEQLIGLTLPDKRVTIIEAGAAQLGDYGGMYSADSRTAYIPETIDKATVAHELSHIWFNKQTFKDKWMSEGLAGYSEKAAGAGNYTACKEPGAYPGTGKPDLTKWVTLGAQPTKVDEVTLDYEYAAACYIFTSLAGYMGPDNFRNVMVAARAGGLPYGDGTADELAGDTTSVPLTSRQLLDFIDEAGMVPGGVTDLDTAGNLLVRYGILDSSALVDRSAARTEYHKLLTAAGTWKMPLVVRQALADWKFDDATAAMGKVKDVLAARDQLGPIMKGLSFDGSQVQTDFEAAATTDDLDAVLATIQKELDAAKTVARAVASHDSSRSMFQTIGLLGTNVDAPLTAARADLAAIKPDAAKAQAQTVIDAIDKANSQGTTRAAMAGGGLVALLLLLLLAIFLIRRKPATPPAPPFGAPGGGWPPTQPPFGPGPGFAQQPQPFGQQPPAQQQPFGQQPPQGFGQQPQPFGQWPQHAQPPAPGQWSPTPLPRPQAVPQAAQAPSWPAPTPPPSESVGGAPKPLYDPYAHLDAADGSDEKAEGWEMPGLTSDPGATPKDPFGQ